MIKGVYAALGWSPSNLPPPDHLVLLGDSVEADASVLLHDMSLFYMDAGVGIVYVSFRESFEWMLGLYRRVGKDLNIMEAQGTYKYFDGCRALVEGSIETMMQDIRSFVDPNQRYLVILDEVSLFKSFDRLVDLFKFVQLLETFINLDMLVYSHGDEINPFYRWLMHRAAIVLETKPLQSGLSREFHGELSCKHGGRSYLLPSLPISPFLFRSTDMSIYFSMKGSRA